MKKKIEIPSKKIYNGISLSNSLKNGTNIISLANYLPNDDYVYEVDFVYAFASDNDIIDVGFSTDLEQFHYSSITHSRNVDDKGQIILNVGKGRTITVNVNNITTGSNPRTGDLKALGYRRLYRDE